MWPFKRNANTSNKQTNTSLYLLHELAQQRAKLSVELQNQKEEKASSFVLKVESTSKPPFLVLDELFPRTVNNSVRQGHQLKMETFLLGNKVQFQTQIIKIEKEKGQTLFLCSLPTNISKQQARSEYRVSISKLKKVPITLMASHRQTLQGTLSDISNTGAGIIIPGALRQPLNQGDTIDYCSIKLENDEAIRGKLIIRRLEYSHSNNETYMGTEFIHLETRYQKSLEKFVASMQRLERRKSITTS